MAHRFLTATGLLGLQRWIWIAIIAALVAAAFVVVSIADNAVEDTIDTARDAGAADARANAAETALQNVETANDAEDDIRLDRGTARYDQCLRTARTPGNCRRFLRDGPPDQR